MLIRNVYGNLGGCRFPEIRKKNGNLVVDSPRHYLACPLGEVCVGVSEWSNVRLKFPRWSQFTLSQSLRGATESSRRANERTYTGPAHATAVEGSSYSILL